MQELFLPYKGRVQLESRYGYRTLNGVYGWHAGVDLVGLDSKTILAPCDGIVRSSTIIEDKSIRTWEWGNYIRIDRADGLQIFLCHMSQRIAKVGQTVKRGDPIGVEGNTGYSFGSHCHFEVRVNGSSTDPTPYLGIKNEGGTYTNPETTETSTQKESVPGDGNTPHDWAKKEVEWAIKKGILKGSSGSKPDYRLNDPVTREEVCIFLYRAIQG